MQPDMTLGQKFRVTAAALFVLAVAEIHGAAGARSPGVAIVRTTTWSPGDVAREGATEMIVLLEIARLQRGSGQAGLVAVGDRRGVFPAGVEAALQAAVRCGVPVVKLASGGRVLPAPHGLFLDGGNLSEAEAAAVLGRCLRLYGALPAAGSPGADGAVSPELYERLGLFQHELTLAASPRLAVR